jgi:putative phosphonate metabolism protein
LRYAIYFAPDDGNALAEAAAVWLGRDAFGREVPPAVGREELVAEPARYGFHGTLKAPFHLHHRIDEASLFDAFDEFCAETSSFEIPEVVIGQLGPFFALVPGKEAHAGVNALAEACVRTFEPFRAPLSAADIARRKPETLPERQRQYLTEWGYPYVFEEFRFHMTLTGAVAEADRGDVRSRLEMHFGSFAEKSLAISHLALFIEPERGAPFNVQRIRPLKAA